MGQESGVSLLPGVSASCKSSRTSPKRYRPPPGICVQLKEQNKKLKELHLVKTTDPTQLYRMPTSPNTVQERHGGQIKQPYDEEEKLSNELRVSKIACNHPKNLM